MRRLRDRIWETPGAEGVQEAAGTQLERIYIGRRQETVDLWVALRPLFEVCERETWCEGGGCRREAWWFQESLEKQLWATLADLWEDKRRRSGGENVTQWEMEGRGRTDWEVRMLGRRRERPRWENDLV